MNQTIATRPPTFNSVVVSSTSEYDTMESLLTHRSQTTVAETEDSPAPTSSRKQPLCKLTPVYRCQLVREGSTRTSPKLNSTNARPQLLSSC